MPAKQVKIQEVGKAVSGVLIAMAKKNRKVVGEFVGKFPQQFELEAISFYPTVLGQPTGQLIGSIQGFARPRDTNSWEAGLRSDKDYAWPHEFGFTGEVTVPSFVRAHPITKQKTVDVREHTRSVNITEKQFLRIPMSNVAALTLVRLKKKINWDGVI